MKLSISPLEKAKKKWKKDHAKKLEAEAAKQVYEIMFPPPEQDWKKMTTSSVMYVTHAVGSGWPR